MDKSKESTSDKAKHLREISNSILLRKEIKHSRAFLLEGAGRDVEKALKLGAFNRPEHTILHTQVEQALSQKNEINPYISAWSEIVLWLKYKKPPFPTDVKEDFPTNCEIVAKAILDEAEAIEQPETARSDDAEKKNEPTGEPLALAMLVKHPDWSDTKIAKYIGVSRTTLYDWPNFKKAKDALKQGKTDLPRGSKNAETGDIEAWED
jgi:DNA-binding transcriptional regulator YiaG